MIGGPPPARIGDRTVPTEHLHMLTGWHWFWWRIAPLFGFGYFGRRRIIAVWTRFMGLTDGTLAKNPHAIRFPDGLVYHVLDARGNHEPL